MPDTDLTGPRIREKRMSLGLRQSALAKIVGISPAYLNLIEHNRRRIGGKLLIDISRTLGVDPSALSQGAESALLAALSEAASDHPTAQVEIQSAEDLAGRFPGWAGLIMAQHRNAKALERAVETLSDRLAHDPHLADSVHEVLSVVTAIHSTSAILADEVKVDPEWQVRFHRNLYEDSQRLADSAQALVEYLAKSEELDAPPRATLPQEQLENWLEQRGYYIAALEGKSPDKVDAVLSAASDLGKTPAARELAQSYLARYAEDAATLPEHRLQRFIGENGADPLAIAAAFRCELALVLRRLSQIRLPGQQNGAGLVVCDGSGAITFNKPLSGFNVARYGASCPLWPLYQALSQPMVPLRVWLSQTGHRPQRYLSYTIAQPRPGASFATPPLFEATMLIIPDDGSRIVEGETIRPVGTSCRTCSRPGCVARSEPSILSGAF